MGFSWGWTTIAHKQYKQRKERMEMSNTTDGHEPQATPPNVNTVPPKEVGWYGRMSKRQRRWFWVGTFVAVILMLGSVGRGHDPKATPVGSPSTAVATAPAPVPGQQSVPAPVAPVDQPAPKVNTVTEPITYSQGDYEVGNGEGQIKPGKYKTTGPDGIFKFSMWTVYGDFDRKNMMAFGSVGDGPGIMTVPKNGKLVTFSGSAEWIKS